MSTTTIQGEECFPFDSVFFNDQINRLIDHTFPLFTKMVKKYVLFHLSFLLLGIIEFFCFLYLLKNITDSNLIAFNLALLFLTFFSYYVLRLYLQSKKPEQFIEIRNIYLASSKQLIGFHEGIPEHNLALANACTKFAAVLQGKEYTLYHLPKWLDFLRSTSERLSSWWHWYDIHHMRELLLQSSIERHIKLVRLAPTDLEVHAGLANTYVLLSSLYVNPHQAENTEEDQWQPPDHIRQIFQRKFRETAERAMEEFKILNDFAPDDPWVHLQLAYSYHDLGMPDEEIVEYESILELCPDDKDILYKLGTLYFQQGQNARGLQVYEELKIANYKKAIELITHYGEY